ncbi:MAG: hypothetical protein KGN16_13625 [Burkholderiales bacterium]|nr:hypothetical protein [Burkholderiales bacterium]
MTGFSEAMSMQGIAKASHPKPAAAAAAAKFAPRAAAPTRPCPAEPAVQQPPIATLPPVRVEGLEQPIRLTPGSNLDLQA